MIGKKTVKNILGPRVCCAGVVAVISHKRCLLKKVIIGPFRFDHVWVRWDAPTKPGERLCFKAIPCFYKDRDGCEKLGVRPISRTRVCISVTT